MPYETNALSGIELSLTKMEQAKRFERIQVALSRLHIVHYALHNNPLIFGASESESSAQAVFGVSRKNYMVVNSNCPEEQGIEFIVKSKFRHIMGNEYILEAGKGKADLVCSAYSLLSTEDDFEATYGADERYTPQQLLDGGYETSAQTEIFDQLSTDAYRYVMKHVAPRVEIMEKF